MIIRKKLIPAELLIAAAVGLMLATGLSATTIAKYDFESSASPLIDVVGTSGMTVTDLTPGAQAATTAVRSAYSRPVDGGDASYLVSGNALAQTFGSSSKAFVTAQSAGAYFEFTLTADGGNTLDLTSLSFDVAYKTGGAHSLRVLVTSDITGDAYGSQLDIGDSNSLANILQSNLGEIGVADDQGNIDWGISDNTVATLGSQFTNISSVTFRLYAFSLAVSNGSTANDLLRFDNIFVNGAVVAIPDSPRPEKPNLLLLLADDLGWQDIKVYDQLETDVVNGFGGTNVFKTDQMDALAADGVMFTHAYSPTPVCAPSRVAIMTGKHAARTDVTSVSGGKCPKAGKTNYSTVTPHFRSSLKDEEYSLAEALRDAGYYTGAFGKWHMSPEGQHYTFPKPMDQGFDVAHNDRGVQNGMSDRTTGFATSDPSDPYQLDANGIAKDSVTEETLNFFADAVSREEPFFCYYSTWLVHTPIQMRTESLLQKYAGLMGYDYPLDGSETFAEGQNNPYYAAMVESLDYYISKLIDYLETTDDPRWPGHKLIENTYIILTSDNGGFEGADYDITDNFPLDKGKIWLREGGVRVPFIAMGPGISSGTLSDVIINGMDIYPTFLALAGASIPSGLDASDLSPLLLNDPLDSAQITDPSSGTERESMFWHFPHSGRNATTLLKDGWKLYKKYTSSPDKYSLYQLYDFNGDAVDLGEQVDVKAAHPQVLSEMSAELDTWMEEVDARPLYWNPQRLDLPLGDQSPKILSTGNDETMAWVTWNTNQAKVKYLDLLYCYQPIAGWGEEWFKIPVPFNHEDGWAEIEIPEGAQSYLFNLIDENLFFYSSVDLTGHSSYSSLLVPLRTWLPETTATFAHAGTTFPTNDILFSNSVGEGAFSAVRDDGTNLQLMGQTFTVTDPVRLAALSLQAHLDFTIGSTDASEYYLWIGQYASGAPGADALRTRVYEKIDMRGVSCLEGNYYTVDFEDTVLLPGTYAFQLRWKGQGTGNNSYWARANGAGGYAGGDLIHISEAAGTVVDYPFSATEAAGNDLVFALHGSADYFGGWTTENALDRIPEDVRSDSVGRERKVQKNNVFYNKWLSTEWTLADGVISNSSAQNNTSGEGAIGICIDVTDLPESDRSQLTLSFDYTTGDAAEKLFVHLWGCVDLDPSQNPEIMHLGSHSGSAWIAVSSDVMDVYNLGRPDGAFTGTAGSGADAAVPGLTGSTGAKSYNYTFDLSTFTTAPDAVTEYDYIVLGFARKVGGTTTPSVSITNIRLSIDDGPTLHEFPLSQVDPTTPEGDPDGDGRSNLYEYGMGGDPNKKSNVGAQPVFDMSGASGEFCYPRRRDAAARKLTYQAVGTSDLVTPDWNEDGITETGTAVIDDDFEEVVNSVPTGGSAGFFRVEIELAE